MDTSNNLLSVLDGFVLDNPDKISQKLAEDFRHRRLERNLSREQVAQMSDVALANVVRFEQKGLISLANFISLAMALGYVSEVKNIFAQPKYSTIEELEIIRKNADRKRSSNINR